MKEIEVFHNDPSFMIRNKRLENQKKKLQNEIEEEESEVEILTKEDEIDENIIEIDKEEQKLDQLDINELEKEKHELEEEEKKLIEEEKDRSEIDNIDKQIEEIDKIEAEKEDKINEEGKEYLERAKEKLKKEEEKIEEKMSEISLVTLEGKFSVSKLNDVMTILDNYEKVIENLFELIPDEIKDYEDDDSMKEREGVLLHAKLQTLYREFEKDKLQLNSTSNSLLVKIKETHLTTDGVLEFLEQDEGYRSLKLRAPDYNIEYLEGQSHLKNICNDIIDDFRIVIQKMENLMRQESVIEEKIEYIQFADVPKEPTPMFLAEQSIKIVDDLQECKTKMINDIDEIRETLLFAKKKQDKILEIMSNLEMIKNEQKLGKLKSTRIIKSILLFSVLLLVG